MTDPTPEESAVTVTPALSRFIASASWNELPEHTRHEAKRAILNGLAAGLAGASDQTMVALASIMGRHAGRESVATIIGSAVRTDVLTAAFLNAARINVFDFDDTHPTILHPTAVVAAAALALAEVRHSTGAELLHAFALGVEVECRIANAISPGHYERGWHITSTCGIFGAAAAASRLLGLPPRQIGWAFGHAAAQSSGNVETLGTLAKSVGVGQAARGGLLAALVAAEGLAGPTAPLEGQRGFFALAADRWDATVLLGGLGADWELLRNSYKPYPCGVVLNPVIDACLQLRRVPGFAVDAIEAIHVRGHPLLRQRTDRPQVITGREAQVSAQHAVAVSLLTGRTGLSEFSDASVGDPRIRALAGKVRLEDDTEIALEGAIVRLSLRDGTSAEARVVAARGSLANPLSDAEIEAKACELAVTGCPACDVVALIEGVWELDRAKDAGALAANLRPRSS